MDLKEGIPLASLTYLQAIILGIVQGLGEFLPISSSGHLALLQKFFGIEGESVLLFAVLLHMGTLLSVFVIYWKDIVLLFKELGFTIADLATGKGLRVNASPERRLGFLIIVATIPTALMGIFLKDLFAGFYESLVAIGVGFLITGTILWIAERNGKGRTQVEGMKFRHAIFIGTMQGIAITPGISRSGSTIFGGLFMGLDRNFALRFAFLVSIPAILGSVVMELPPALEVGIPDDLIGPIVVGTLVSAIMGFVAIKAMLKLVANLKLSFFSFYTWGLGIIVLILALMN
jgi:undecaprenyl-diphosphatase